MKIYEAVIGKYLGICESEDGYCYQVDPKSKRQIEGIVVGNYIYDLVNEKRYYIIKRDTKSGMLKDSQFRKIKTGVEYALDVKPKMLLKTAAKVKRMVGSIKR